MWNFKENEQERDRICSLIVHKQRFRNEYMGLKMAINNTFILFLLFSSILLAQENKIDFLPQGNEITQETTKITNETTDESKIQRFNLLFYTEEWMNHENYLIRFLPLYSYQRNRDLLQDDFFFWPLLAGYEVSRNPIATSLPYAVNFQWRNIPFLSLGGSYISPTESRETSSIVSLLLMTFSREISAKDEYYSREWYSLPVLSFYHSESTLLKEAKILHTLVGNPLFYIQDSQIAHKEQRYSVYEWSIHPLSLALGKESFYIAYQGRWGRDRLFEVLGCEGFSLFTIGTTVSEYPGAHYQRFIASNGDMDKNVFDLLYSKPGFPTTRLGILYPFFMVETNPNAGFRWQILPLFHYYSEKEKYALQILPLFMEINQDGLSLKISPKFFPLVYHDEMYQRWDILWPLFYYQNNPSFSAEKWGCRFLFQYQKTSPTQASSKVTFNVLEGILLSYQGANETNQFEILPGGILFGYYETALDIQWRLLGFGYEETSQRRSLQILFIKIPLQYKYAK